MHKMDMTRFVNKTSQMDQFLMTGLVFVQHLKVGIKGKPPVIDGETYKEIKLEESTWCIEDGKEVILNIEKVLSYMIWCNEDKMDDSCQMSGNLEICNYIYVNIYLIIYNVNVYNLLFVGMLA